MGAGGTDRQTHHVNHTYKQPACRAQQADPARAFNRTNTRKNGNKDLATGNCGSTEVLAGDFSLSVTIDGNQWLYPLRIDETALITTRSLFIY